MVIDETRHADDVPGAAELIGRVYGHATISAPASPSSFRFRQRRVGDERATFARWSFDTDVAVEVDVRNDMVLGVAAVASGACHTSSNGDAVDAARPFLFRPGRVRARSGSSGFEMSVVNLDTAALARFLDGRDALPSALRFPGTAPRSAEHERRWYETVAFAESQLRGTALTNDLLRTTVVDLLFATAAECFPVDRDPTFEAHAVPAAVRRAIRLMEDQADRPLTAEDLAEAAGMTPRGLLAAFRRSLGTTPHAYLRRVRLSAAHDELVAGSAGAGRNVSEVALRWGFSNRGRFAVAYQDAYGESPRETLER